MNISTNLLAVLACFGMAACGSATPNDDFDAGANGGADAAGSCGAQTDCDGVCIDTATDVDNCGGCGMACAAEANATATCEDSACVYTCEAGFDSCADGPDCETNLNTDIDNCGACGTVCAAQANSTPVCDGDCQLECDAGFDDCTADDGCETDVTADAVNCGACGVMCNEGDSCVDSACSGNMILNGDFANGLLDPWTDQNNPINDNDTVSTFQVVSEQLQSTPSSGPSARVVFQDFVVPDAVFSAAFSFNFFQDNSEPLDPANVTIIEKDPFDANADGFNQNAFRIDIVSAAEADVFNAPILFELFAPVDALGAIDALEPVLINDPALLTFLQSQVGVTLRLRLGHVESTFPWGISLDDLAMTLTY